MLKTLLFFFFLLPIVVVGNCPLYFSYSENEITHIKDVDSEFRIMNESLKKWDDVVYALAEKNQVKGFKHIRLMTYLYVAQEEAANLSMAAHNELKGSLDPLCEAVLQLFFSDYKRPKSYDSDIYSAKLRNLVFPRLKERFRAENHSKKEFELKAELKQNPDTYYKIGTNIAKWEPWVAKPSMNFWPPPPPDVWDQEIAELKAVKGELTPEKCDKILFWAGEKGFKSGDWVAIANDYIFSHEIKTSKILEVRSQLMKGIYDTTIVFCGAKYFYSVVRPKIKDPLINYEIPLPNHPSYPSGHSSTGAVAATILSHYFQDATSYWWDLTEEAGITRIWAGIHYPIDHRAGINLGKKVGEAILKVCE